MKRQTIGKRFHKSNKNVHQPLNSYNVFFKVQRMRILQGANAPRGPFSEEEVRIVMQEHYKQKNTGVRRAHRKTHGKIGFRDLARVIAEEWKKVDSKTLCIIKREEELEKDRHRDYLNKERTSILSKEKEDETPANPRSSGSDVSSGEFIFTNDQGRNQATVDSPARISTPASPSIPAPAFTASQNYSGCFNLANQELRNDLIKNSTCIVPVEAAAYRTNQSCSCVTYYQGQEAYGIVPSDLCPMNSWNDRNNDYNWSELQIQQCNEEINHGCALGDEGVLLKIEDALLTEDLVEMLVCGQDEVMTPQIFDTIFTDEGNHQYDVLNVMEHEKQLNEWIAVLRETSLEPIPPLVLDTIFHEEKFN